MTLSKGKAELSKCLTNFHVMKAYLLLN